MAKPLQYPSIDPARLRHKIQILRPVTSIGTSGSSITWEPFITTNAAIEPASARDVIRNGQAVSEVMIPITIRYRVGVEANMRVAWGAERYVIRGMINTQERGIITTLMCVGLGANE